MPVQLDLFKQNCDNAASMLLMFEKALPLDKSTCAHKLKDLPIPRGLESEWIFIVDVWMAFYHQLSVDLSVIDTPPSFADFSSSKILRHSDDVRTFISNLKNHINPAKIDSLNSSYSVEMLSNAELKDKFRSACDKAASLLDDIETLSSSEKKKREVQLSKVSYPDLLSSSWAVIEDIWKSFVYQGYVDTKKLQHPSNLKIKHTPYPIRGSAGVKILIRSIGDYITIPKDSFLTMTEKKNLKQSPSHSIEKVAKKPLLKKSSGNDNKYVVQNKYVDSINCGDVSIVSNSANLTTKEQILASYEQYISKLDTAISNIQAIRANNRKLEKIQDECLAAIVHLLDESKNQMNQVMTETVWDKLVIAFFGETNAGKSTIIEAFRCRFNDVVREESIKKNNGKGVDGLIVGDGRSDFTQVYEKYNLSINNEPFVLIDVPGIQGDEKNYLEEIGRALKQAHCIFYVQGHNKKPDSAVAEEIKRFLSDWVDVYSIYNVRGSVSDYDEEDERETLMTQQKLEIQNSIEEVFRDILPNVYKGNVSLQGLLALLSVADFHETRQDLISNQEKIIHYFSGRENVLVFSHFNEIVKLIQEQSSNFGENILEANKNKLVSLSKRIQKGITSIIDEESGKLNSLSEQLISFRKSVKSFKSDICSIARSQMNNEVNQALTALRSSMNDIIDDGNDVNEWSSRLNYRANRISDALEGEIRKISIQSQEDFHRRIENKRKDLDKIAFTNFSLRRHDISINVDLSGVLDKLTLNFKNAMGGFLSGFFNPIGSLLKLFKNSEDGRKEAKQILGKEIDKLRPEIFSNIDSIHYELEEKLMYDENRLITSIESEISNIKQISNLLENLRKQFI